MVVEEFKYITHITEVQVYSTKKMDFKKMKAKKLSSMGCFK